MESLNVSAIIVSTLVAFAIGAIWYSPILFGKEWLALIKMNDRNLAEAKKGVWKLYILQLIITLISYSVLAFLIAVSDSRSYGDGALIGFLYWLGAILPVGASQIMWEKTSSRLVLINTIGLLIPMIIGGAIIGAWM